MNNATVQKILRKTAQSRRDTPLQNQKNIH